MNLLYFVALPELYKHYPETIGVIYSPNVGVGYAFFLNLVCTGVIMLCLLPELRGFKYKFDRDLLRRMLKYSMPILVLGIAGILNQTADKILFPFIYNGNDASSQLGVYGAASKIAMIMAMITQAFRYAYEPFVFGKSKDRDSKATYAVAMKYFLVFTLLAFLMVVGYMDIIKYIIAPGYWEGLKVVPIVMVAEIMMGVYFNLSFWYKLIDKTMWGALFSGVGCAVLIAVNVIFIPEYGYMACAWGGVAGYGTAMLLSYLVGQKYYPISYPLRNIAVYVLISAGIYALMECVALENVLIKLAFNTLLIVLFVLVVGKCENVNFVKLKKSLRR